MEKLCVFPVIKKQILFFLAKVEINMSDYRKYLGDATIPELLDALKQSKVGWTPPNDPTVGRFHGYWKGCTSVVSKENGRVFKKQTAYNSYPLVANEWAILTQINSIHFPKAYSFVNGILEIEDCGIQLLSCIPNDWESQLDDIIEDLELSGVLHRDIRLDNLLVKDGVIKLIDFGWSRFLDTPDEKEPPECLGFPNKPSWGFDDNHSMRILKKQIAYHLEEKHDKGV